MAGEKAQRPGFYFIACPDAELVIREAEDILKKYPPSSGQWEKNVFWGDEEPGEEFWQKFNQGGLFGASRAILARRAQEWPASVWKGISAVLGGRNETVFPVFCLESPWEKGKIKIPAHIAKLRCMEFAEKKGWICKKQGITPATLGKYVDNGSRKLGLKFSPEARALFCKSVSLDAAAISSELEKLALACGEGEIGVEMISIGAANPETDAFECLKRLEEGNLGAAWQELSKNRTGNLVFYLVAIIAREMRVLWQLNMGLEPWMPPDALARKKRLARRIGLKGVDAGLTAALDAEWHIKSGLLSPEQALEKLVARIAGIYGVNA